MANDNTYTYFYHELDRHDAVIIKNIPVVFNLFIIFLIDIKYGALPNHNNPRISIILIIN
jgi:hypothetical protein